MSADLRIVRHGPLAHKLEARGTLQSQIDALRAENAWLRTTVVSIADRLGVLPRERSAIILDEVAAAHGVSIIALKSSGKSPDLVRARHEFCYRALDETTGTAVHIGKFLGDRDHSTVLNGARRHAERNNLPKPRGMK